MTSPQIPDRSVDGKVIRLDDTRLTIPSASETIETQDYLLAGVASVPVCFSPRGLLVTCDPGLIAGWAAPVSAS